MCVSCISKIFHYFSYIITLLYDFWGAEELGSSLKPTKFNFQNPEYFYMGISTSLNYGSLAQVLVVHTGSHFY